MVIFHRKCNRLKGRRTPAMAGLALHLTGAHRAALELREKCSPPEGAAGLLRAMFERDPWPLDAQRTLFGDVPRPSGPSSADADALTGARAPAWHGTAGPGPEGVGDGPARRGTVPAEDGPAPRGRRRRRRRRAKKTPRTSDARPIHDDGPPHGPCERRSS